ncbi:MAG TPA: diaminopimelate decarboxylase [Candidatus Saccharimonadales bacterium]|nr:diaminopimelate decarboxylase [Candidatus Saccharimonadales bacterium]
MWLSDENAHRLVERHGTPLYVYSMKELEQRARVLLALMTPFGMTVRYAIKANPHPVIISLLDDLGLHFDASSSYEAEALLQHGIAGDKISLSSQIPAHNLSELLQAGVQYVATSMHQLELLSDVSPKGSKIALRVNPGLGSGHSHRTITAGTNASFGLWHEYLNKALDFARGKGLVIDRLHIHIGAGAESSIWARVMDTALRICEQVPEATTLDIGGGYKVHRYGEEAEADMAEIVEVFSKKLNDFAKSHGRQLKLEIEPGTWLVAHVGCLLTTVVDIVDTGKDSYTFLRTDTGMNDILRPTLYGARHTIRSLNDSKDTKEYVVVGHNCETGDILTTKLGDPDAIEPRLLSSTNIGDTLIIEDTGAYCASLRARGYNAFPDAPEILV